MDPIDFQRPLRRYFQKRRFKSFISDYQSCKTILDVGGGYYTWEILGRSSGVTILNIQPTKDTGGFTHFRGSACNIPFPDRSFDLAFSNSAIDAVSSLASEFLADSTDSPLVHVEWMVIEKALPI
jgi:hypothetical protein